MGNLKVAQSNIPAQRRRKENELDYAIGTKKKQQKTNQNMRKSEASEGEHFNKRHDH